MRVGVLLSLIFVTRLVFAEPVYTGGWFGHGPAIKGYDPVAYFTDGRARKGSAKHTVEYDGVQWRFVSAEHRALFLAAPEQYAPAYGGYCAYAMGALDQRVKVDPEVFSIVDGRLFLNYSQSVRDDWLLERDSYINKADKNWERFNKSLGAE